mmetsp:Transcript_17638/g.54735  ORF Transcript_17638/g.54735 Transcript_17638/m.54735 type:complete len:207 (+) Transcript_17638:1613-2233(+)
MCARRAQLAPQRCQLRGRAPGLFGTAHRLLRLGERVTHRLLGVGGLLRLDAGVIGLLLLALDSALGVVARLPRLGNKILKIAHAPQQRINAFQHLHRLLCLGLPRLELLNLPGEGGHIALQVCGSGVSLRVVVEGATAARACLLRVHHCLEGREDRLRGNFLLHIPRTLRQVLARLDKRLGRGVAHTHRRGLALYILARFRQRLLV